MLAFEVKGGYKPVVRFVEGVRLASLAVSLGGVETLVEHAASMTHGTPTPQERKLAGIDEGLIRVSVGLEAANDFIEDFGKHWGLAGSAVDAGTKDLVFSPLFTLVDLDALLRLQVRQSPLQPSDLE